MNIVKQQWWFNEPISELDIMKRIEKAARVCYKSENRISEESANHFIAWLISIGHESVLEHEKITVTVICDRGISHQIVRHRIASYSQESTRFCNYSDNRFGNEITVISPSFWEENEETYKVWKSTLEVTESAYNKLIELGAKPEEARSVLPNSLKTEIVITMNIREWRHFLRIRTMKEAHPQMKELATDILNAFRIKLPTLFGDI